MKKFLLSILCLMLATFSIQAQEVTLDFTTNNWGFPEKSANKKVETANFTYDGYTIALTGGGASNGYYFTSGYLMLGKTNATLTLPASVKDARSIELEAGEHSFTLRLK